MDGFDIIKNSRGQIQNEAVLDGQVVQNTGVGADKLMGAVADNFDTILGLATDIVDIQKMRVQSEITIAEIREKRQQLLAEAQAYALRRDADTRNIVERMKVIREMMNDFYQHNTQNMSSEDFRIVITSIVEQMGKLEND